MENVNPNAQTIENSLKEILKYIGEDPEREGLKDTPKRIVKMWLETMRGYDPKQKPKITTFQNGIDGIVYDELIVDNGNYYSNCEHHFVPFFGQYWFAYIPHTKGKILGLSKVARIVDYYSAKLQIQERLCSDIIDAIEAELNCEYPPLGIGIIMKGEHLCKTMRGVKKQGVMTTSYLKGLLKTDHQARAEFLSLIK
jgi:GTP cyclohydrolase I